MPMVGQDGRAIIGFAYNGRVQTPQWSDGLSMMDGAFQTEVDIYEAKAKGRLQLPAANGFEVKVADRYEFQASRK